jgi:hypothetical protein
VQETTAADVQVAVLSRLARVLVHPPSSGHAHTYRTDTCCICCRSVNVQQFTIIGCQVTAAEEGPRLQGSCKAGVIHRAICARASAHIACSRGSPLLPPT